MQPMDDSVSDASSPDTLRKTAPNRCKTRGHVPTRCPSKWQGNRPDQEEDSQSHGTHREECKRSQDQPQFLHINNRYLHCASNHQSHDCPTRQQHQANTTSNPASGSGIYQNTSKFANTSPTSQQSQSTVGITTPTLPVTNPPLQHNFQHPLPINPHLNYQAQPPHFQQFTQPQVSPLQIPPQPFNPQILPPYFPQYPPSNSPLAGSNDSSILAALQKQWEKQERLDKEHFGMERQKEERKRMKEEWEQKKEEWKRLEKQENQQCTHINKASEKIPRFNGMNPSYCFDWLEQTEALVNEHQGRVYREELLLNCGTSVAKTIHALPQETTNQQIKDAVLQTHSNLRTVSQCSNAYQQLQQKPDKALQTYNTRYTSYFNLTYPKLEINNPLSRMHCIHYASSLYGKLSDEMTGRFNQDLPQNLHAAFEKAENFEPRIITKQSINESKVHNVNNIDITQGLEEIEINKAHIWNLDYKGKNYDPNYQQNKNKNNFNNNSSTGASYQNNGNQGQGNHYMKNNHQEKPVNVSVMLNGPISKEQLYKLQEVLRHPSQYRDRLKPED